jgi:hypothetical protein
MREAYRPKLRNVIDLEENNCIIAKNRPADVMPLYGLRSHTKGDMKFSETISDNCMIFRIRKGLKVNDGMKVLFESKKFIIKRTMYISRNILQIITIAENAILDTK